VYDSLIINEDDDDDDDDDFSTITNTAIASPLLLAYLIQSSSIFIELLVSGKRASVVYKI